jgi:hypothetical protein
MENNEGFIRQDLQEKILGLVNEAKTLRQKYERDALFLDEEKLTEAETGMGRDGYWPESCGSREKYSFLDRLDRPLTAEEWNRVSFDFQNKIISHFDPINNPELNSRDAESQLFSSGFGDTLNGFGKKRGQYREILYHNILATDKRPDWGGNNSKRGKLLDTYGILRAEPYNEKYESMGYLIDFLSTQNGRSYDIDNIRDVLKNSAPQKIADQKVADFDKAVKAADINGITACVEDLLTDALPETFGDEKRRRETVRQYGNVCEVLECIKMNQRIYDKGQNNDLSMPGPEMGK